MKLIHPPSQPTRHRTSFVADHHRRRSLPYADEPLPLVRSASQAHPQVRHDLVTLSGPFTLAAPSAIAIAGFGRSNLSPALTPAKGLFANPKNFPGPFLQNYLSPFILCCEL